MGDSVKKPGRAAPVGILGMTDDQHAAFIRDNHIEFVGPTPESVWEEQLLEAIKSGAIERGKPGRKQLRPHYLVHAEKCLREANGNLAKAREAFIKQQTRSQSIERKTAANRWAEAMKMLFPKR
jgi:hypothetical protein